VGETFSTTNTGLRGFSNLRATSGGGIFTGWVAGPVGLWRIVGSLGGITEGSENLQDSPMLFSLGFIHSGGGSTKPASNWGLMFEWEIIYSALSPFLMFCIRWTASSWAVSVLGGLFSLFKSSVVIALAASNLFASRVRSMCSMTVPIIPTMKIIAITTDWCSFLNFLIENAMPANANPNGTQSEAHDRVESNPNQKQAIPNISVGMMTIAAIAAIAHFGEQ
jgi:hypothetical protein